jgi:hypothetical protein
VPKKAPKAERWLHLSSLLPLPARPFIGRVAGAGGKGCCGAWRGGAAEAQRHRLWHGALGG